MTRWVHHEVLNALMSRYAITGVSLARTVGLHASTIRHLRNGTRRSLSDETAALIADALGVSVDTLSVEAANVMVVQQTPRPCGLERVVNGR